PGMMASRAESKPGKVNDTERVRLDLLDKTPGYVSVGGKNIFQSLFQDESIKKIPVPLPPPPPPPEKKPAPPPVQQPQVQPPPVIEPPHIRELANFTFLGFLKKDSLKKIFLTNGKEIFVVKKGDKIANKYDVTSITDDAITITSLQDTGDIIIPLIENRPLNAPKK